MDKTVTCKVCYGKKQLDLTLPRENLAGYLVEKTPPATEDEDALLAKALMSPVASQRLSEMASPGSKVAIVTDDITRPTPTAKMLPLVVAELAAAGVREEDITLVFAMGSHRPHTKEEQARLLGDADWFDRIRVVDHDAFDLSQLVHLGKTVRGTPVHINKWVAHADLKIMMGLIKPHCCAGYTGGGKAILPGVSSIDTIIADHNYEATAHPLAIFGVIDGNPIRADIEDAAGLLAPTFIFNAILDREKRVVAAVSGHMIEAHRKGAALLDEMVCADVGGLADIAVTGCSYPTSINLYQACNAALSCVRVRRPIVRRGGVCVIAAPCDEGVGGGPLHELMREAASPEDLFARISQPGFFMHDQWAAQLWSMVLAHCDLHLVADGISEQDAADMKCRLFPTLDAAVKAAFDKMGSAARVTVLADGPYIIPRLTSDDLL